MEFEEDGALSFVVTSTGTNTNQSTSAIAQEAEQPDDGLDEELAEDEEFY